ncbi:MAG: MgtC/SapB transporter [Parcubacteria group bacterium GW2011_GWA1_44_13]|uniref:MgtC/SapB transporter n=1 Tax=Candidatus Nomurabacteria bacterium GW2011_GWB1_44_12 TaxID=1618748 RepID=A0A837I7D1_9BACT|nr:MAG: MgtC/SapB transporter [Candidatus Nomurabacteria bacterium GW2011_GWB1_44_12]KKT38073.1 MAG: MgtC/SapB transporter [Parcubacteria group bacterium GW2011_GWA1_44_13]HBB44350.1 magnesium transporter MgtC [Candidatus Yonathbacteria bacterium]
MDITTLLSSQDLEIILKLFTAMFLGMSLGIERALAGKTAGMRTYGFVTMGSALFVIVGVLASGGYDSNATVFTDSSARVTAAIIQGIGFIGAGLIIFKGSKVSGVTTAAGIWVAAGVGVAIGYGYYVLAVIATIFALFIFTGLWYIENKVKALAHFSPED